VGSDVRLSGSAVQGDQRSGKAGAGAIKKEAHAQSLVSLRGNQAALAADMIRIGEQSGLRLIEISSLFEAADALFNAATEARADF
jgi:hypothetical protein